MLVDARIILWGKQTTFENLNLRLRTADPQDGCEPYNYKESHHGTAFLVNGLKNCPLTTLINNAQTHGAKALFIVNDKDTNIEEIEVPDHISGVHIHVFIINHSDGQSLIDITEQARGDNSDWHIKSKIEIDFLEYAARGDSIKLQMIYSPDNREAMKFLADMFTSKFAKDIGSNKKIKLRLNYNLLNCESCRLDGYRLPKEDCLSGGRYCMKSTMFDNLKGQQILIQVLKNKCTEAYLRRTNKEELIGNYYYLTFANCLIEFHPACYNAVLKKLGIDTEVLNCVYGSFDNEAKRNENFYTKSPKPHAMLQDNYLLSLEKQYFNTIKHYARFPLVKINDIHYYGPLSYYAIFGFICRHINDGFDGCASVFTEEEITIVRNSKFFQISLIGIVVLCVISTIFICRRQLKVKFDNELSIRIDQSVTEFLSKEKKSEYHADEEDRDEVRPVDPIEGQNEL